MQNPTTIQQPFDSRFFSERLPFDVEGLPHYPISNREELLSEVGIDADYWPEELSLLFLVKTKRFANNIREWLQRRFLELYEEPLDILIKEVNFNEKTFWGIFVKEEYEVDAVGLLEVGGLLDEDAS